MKYLIASDLHGDIVSYRILLERTLEENPDKVVLLGDLMEYARDIPAINAILDQIPAPILAVSGNCDREEWLKMFHVENKGLKFVEDVGNRRIFYTHGHIYGVSNMPSILKKGDVFLYGHWHKGKLEKKNEITVANTGSIARPRNSVASYIILKDNEIVLKDVNGETISKLGL